MIKIPYNYRRVKTNEKLKLGFLYYNKSTPGLIMDINTYMCGGNIAANYPTLCFFCARKQDHVSPAPTTATPKHPLVEFLYPNKETFGYSQRTVEVISLDDKYLIGLEKTGKKYKFKKFLRVKMPVGVGLVKF